MPIHEFTCRKCGKDFEELVSLRAESYPPCPACHATEVEKKISACGTIGAGSCGSSGFS